MRKLALVPVLCLALAVPAAAAPLHDGIADGGASATLVATGLADPLDVHQARRKLRTAARRARPEPEPPAAPVAAPVAVPAHLQAIAQCESGGDPAAIGGGGLYRGKYQFAVETWQAVGGSGDPAAAPEAEQDRRAIALYEQSGPGQWPVCGS